MSSDLNYQRRADGWWITGTWPYYVDGHGPYEEYGPYRTKEEVAEAMRAVARTMQTIIDEGLCVGQDHPAPPPAIPVVEAPPQQLALAFGYPNPGDCNHVRQQTEA